jgi:hypothetical protein
MRVRASVSIQPGCLRRRAVAGLLVTALLLGVRTPAAAQDVGTVEGVVVDSKTGDPIIEAGVEVIDQNKKVKTDLDGKYSIKLPPGSYELRIFAPLYQGTRLKNLIITAGKITRADANLKPEGEAAVETVEVVAEAKKSAETTQILQRQKAATVSDNISSQQIAKSPDSKASEIVRRVPAVTVKDNKYIVVRGLGERYSTALLNGSRLPSTDPNKRVIPLDLFPGDFIDALTIIKTYTPDLPGDFAGGLLDIQLREFPARFTWSMGVQTSVNTATTFQDFGTYLGAAGLLRRRTASAAEHLQHLPEANHGLHTVDHPDARPGRQPGDNETSTRQPPRRTSTRWVIGITWGLFGNVLAGVFGWKFEVHRGEVNNSYTSDDQVQDNTGEIFTHDVASQKPSSAPCSPHSTSSTRTTDLGRTGESAGNRCGQTGSASTNQAAHPVFPSYSSRPRGIHREPTRLRRARRPAPFLLGRSRLARVLGAVVAAGAGYQVLRLQQPSAGAAGAGRGAPVHQAAAGLDLAERVSPGLLRRRHHPVSDRPAVHRCLERPRSQAEGRARIFVSRSLVPLPALRHRGQQRGPPGPDAAAGQPAGAEKLLHVRPIRVQPTELRALR